MCSNLDLTLRSPRPLYDWEPHGCSLDLFEPSSVCSLLHKKSVLFVGDSTVAQLFISFVSLLGGTFGVNVKRASILSDITASACSDTTRLNFVRSDLLLWSHTAEDFREVRSCDGYTTLLPFAIRASREADLLVLGIGHHFPSSLEMVAGKQEKREKAAAERGKQKAAAQQEPHEVVVPGQSLPRNTGIKAADTLNERRLMGKLQGKEHGKAAKTKAKAKDKEMMQGKEKEKGTSFPGKRLHERANPTRAEKELARQAFFGYNLNHTLSSAITSRANAGYTQPAASIFVVPVAASHCL